MFKLIRATFILIQKRCLPALLFLSGVSECASSFECFYCYYYYYRWVAREVGTRTEPITPLCTYLCAHVFTQKETNCTAQICVSRVHCIYTRHAKNYVQIH